MTLRPLLNAHETLANLPVPSFTQTIHDDVFNQNQLHIKMFKNVTNRHATTVIWKVQKCLGRHYCPVCSKHDSLGADVISFLYV
jgi:hypothetical protein